MMPTVKQIIFASILVFALLSWVTAQEKPSAQGTLPTIVASASGERIRITGPSSIVQLRVEVYNGGGEKLVDQEIRGGNVFDWHLQDGQGQRLATGTYVCVVTAKNVSGKLTQKTGTVNVAEKSMSVQAAASLSAPQAQTIGPVEENSSWTIAGTDDPQTPTVIAHDGTDGQMIRGRGALSFRIGNFFTGNDSEQMRLTEAGDLGIGTSEPKSKLDVAGTIRAQRFLMARPKSNAVDKTAMASDNLTTDSVDFQPLIAGTGTQNRIAKWTDNAGTLGDSGITETASGLVGIGTSTPDSKLVVSSNSAPLPPATGIARFADADGVQTAVFADAFGTNPVLNVRRANGTAAAPSAVQANQLLGVIGAAGFGTSQYSGTRARVAFLASENWTNIANGTYLTFNTTANGAATPGGTERVRIDNLGNVGIGTSNPGTNLDVQNSAGSALIRARSTSGGGSVLFLDRAAAANSSQIGFYTAGGADFTLGTNQGSAGFSDLSIYNYGTNSNALTILKSNGNVGIGATGPGAALEVRRDGTVASDWQTGQLRLSGASNPNMQLSLGYDTSSNLGVIQAGQAFTAFRNLALNPLGGSVSIGTTNTFSGKLQVEGGNGTAVYGFSNTSRGVAGATSGGTGVEGDSTTGTSVFGFTNSGVGVKAETNSGVGVMAETTTGDLVEGFVDITLPDGIHRVRTFHIPPNGTYVSGSDFAEALPASGDRAAYEPGDVLVMSIRAPGKIEKASRPYDSRVAGIYSTRPGMLGADKNGTSRVDPDELPVAIVGIVPAKVSAMNGPVRVGDLLTTSSVPGYAMRCTNHAKCVGAIVGKALEPLSQGKAVIKVLVMLR